MYGQFEPMTALPLHFHFTDFTSGPRLAVFNKE